MTIRLSRCQLRLTSIIYQINCSLNSRGNSRLPSSVDSESKGEGTAGSYLEEESYTDSLSSEVSRFSNSKSIASMQSSSGTCAGSFHFTSAHLFISPAVFKGYCSHWARSLALPALLLSAEEASTPDGVRLACLLLNAASIVLSSTTDSTWRKACSISSNRCSSAPVYPLAGPLLPVRANLQN